MPPSLGWPSNDGCAPRCGATRAPPRRHDRHGPRNNPSIAGSDRMPVAWTGRTRRCARARSTGPTQARTDTQNAPPRAQRDPAEPLMNGGPPPSFRSALHPGLHRLAETTSRAWRYPSSAEGNTSLCCRWIQARWQKVSPHIPAFHTSTALPRRTRSQGTIAASCSSPSRPPGHTC